MAPRKATARAAVHVSDRRSKSRADARPALAKAPSKQGRALEAIAKIRGLESEMAEVIRDTQEKVRQLETLNSLAGLLNSSLDTSIVRQKSLEATCQLLRCETASLFLIDEAKRELYWETALGEVGEELKRTVRLPINDQSIAGYVAMTGESLLINDVEKDPRYFKKAGDKSGFRTHTMVCAPLRARDKVIGVLQAINKLPGIGGKASAPRPEFTPSDLMLLGTLSHQVAIAIENSQLYTRIKRNFFDTVEALAEAIEKKDHYTGGHTKRVVHYSVCIAKYMDLDPGEMERVRMGAILHDIGKIGIADKILKKDAPLDPEEWKVMQTHPELGYDIMNRVDGLKDVIGAMRYHHERWDGKGYPLKLKGEDIPMLARIVAVADTYDAMVSTRPYRKGMDPKIAYDEIVRYSGTQFDPKVVEAFKKAFQNEKMGRGSGGSTLSNCD